MDHRSLSSIRRFWTGLKETVHPDDQPIFDRHPGHSFNLDFPPPAFIGDVDHAPIVVLMSNGGYNDGKTQNEFPDENAIREHRDYLRGERVGLPRYLSRYYLGGPLGPWIAEGSAVLVNAVPYRSLKLSSEKENQKVAGELRSLAAHRSWLKEEVLPEAKAGRRFVLVHRKGWWDIPAGEYGACVLFSEQARAEPNRRTPDKAKLGHAENWLRQHYRSLGPDPRSIFPAAQKFAERFATWGIRLPMPALVARKPGHIYSEGWFIWYRFGLDQWGEFLDYYANHRMSGESHVRIRDDGREEYLLTMSNLMPTSSDPAEAERMKIEYYARNREIAQMVREKGFDLDHKWSSDE